MSSDNLPVILVSASDNIVATKIISELIDNELEDNIYGAEWRVWQLENKYYSAAVRLQPLPDVISGAEALGEPDAPGESYDAPADAHVIYLADDEDETVAEARGSRAAGRLRRGAVRLALVDAPEAAEAVVAWGLRARYEVVPLREAEGAEDEAAGGAGVGRARDALHAHVWPGLRRRGARPPPAPLAVRKLYNGLRTPRGGRGGSVTCAPTADDEESSDGGEDGVDGGDGGDGAEDAVERAEAFAEALGALAALAERRGELRDDPHDELRRERAEQLVAAFCRALGHDLRDQLA